ncbi:MAG: hypothetical protein Q8P82_01535 [bacterium]|nr:hypothetical protein [bacterium]
MAIPRGEGMRPEAEPVDPHETFRKEIKKQVEYIAEEARRGKPPRFIRFSEAEIGSRTFVNKRYIDEKTDAVLSEEIEYDPSLFWDGPPAAFYAALWHEFGHGEERYHTLETNDKKMLKLRLKAAKEETGDLLNVKYDIFIDSNNRFDRPGLVEPYRSLYEYFFPREVKEGAPPELARLAADAGLKEEVQQLGGKLQQALGRPFHFLLAMKHDAYWHHEDNRRGIAEADRKPNPYLDDELQEPYRRISSAVIEAGDAKKGTPRRSDLFNRIVIPEYFKIIDRRVDSFEETIQVSLETEEINLSDARDLEVAIRDTAQRTQARQIRVFLETQIGILKTEAEKIEADAAQYAGELAEGGFTTETSEEAERVMEEARGKAEEARVKALEAEGDAAAMIAQVEMARLDPEDFPVPAHAREAAERILDALRELKKQQNRGGHAQHTEVPINPQDKHHPKNEGFEELFPSPPAPKTGTPPPPKPTPQKTFGSGKEGQKGTGAGDIKKVLERGITPAEHKEYRDIFGRIDETALHELIHGLVRSFSEDRERVIIGGMPFGKLPTARKAEAVRRRYAGEALPPVREVRKTTERFMGVDIIFANDHSGSMAGVKENAAKAANVSMAHGSYRVNTEIRRRMRRSGMSDSQIDAAPPLRYLGIAFGGNMALMNSRGWKTSLHATESTIGDQEIEEEKFVVDMFKAYQGINRKYTFDAYASALAILEAFEDTPNIQKPEERVKVICFITDGVGLKDDQSALMQYLHGKTDEIPAWLAPELERIRPGSSEKTLARLRTYRDQVFAVAIGIPDPFEEGSAQAFADVYNEGKIPNERDIRVHEENNVAILELTQIDQLPRKILQIFSAKFNSPKFRQIRNRFQPVSRRR